MAVGIKIVGFANGRPCKAAGQWVEWYDPDAFDGGGDLLATADPSRAKQFKTIAQAVDYYRQISRIKPKRWDGQPNRPATTFTVVMERLPADVPDIIT